MIVLCEDTTRSSPVKWNTALQEHDQEPTRTRHWRSSAVLLTSRCEPRSYPGDSALYLHDQSDRSIVGYPAESMSTRVVAYLGVHTSSKNSFSHERRSRVNTSSIANTRGGSHIKDGKEVMRRLRYREATSRALAIRCVLARSRDRNSDGSSCGSACFAACTFISLMQPRMTYIGLISTSNAIISKWLYLFGHRFHANMQTGILVQPIVHKERHQRRWKPRRRAHVLHIVHAQQKYDLSRKQVADLAGANGYMLCQQSAMSRNDLRNHLNS